jgi:exonuclease III
MHSNESFVSFNIGLRGLHRSIKHFGTASALVRAVGNPLVLGLQETKLSRKTDLPPELLVQTEEYQSVWSCCLRGTPYAGVALFVRNERPIVACACKLASIAAMVGDEQSVREFALLTADDTRDWQSWAKVGGLTAYSAVEVADAEAAKGTDTSLQSGTEVTPDTSMAAVERSEWAGLSAEAAAVPRTAGSFTPGDIDAEGRIIAADLGFCVVINAYFPCAASGSRVAYKSAFHDAISGLCARFVRAGREVILMGDVNASHGLLDHSAPDQWVKMVCGPSSAGHATILQRAASAPAFAAVASGATKHTVAGSAASAWSAHASSAAITPQDSLLVATGSSPSRQVGSAPLHTSSSAPLASRSLASGLLPASEAAVPIIRLSASAKRQFCGGMFRRWLTDLVGADGDADALSRHSHSGETAPMMVDSFRRFFPTLRGAFSCWSEMTSARKTNYGTRIDYVLVTKRLAASRLVHAQVLQGVFGSDHCPVTAVLSLSAAELHGPAGSDRAAYSDPDACDPMRWPQFAAKQKRISSFFSASFPSSSSASASASSVAGGAFASAFQQTTSPSRSASLELPTSSAGLPQAAVPASSASSPTTKRQRPATATGAYSSTSTTPPALPCASVLRSPGRAQPLSVREMFARAEAASRSSKPARPKQVSLMSMMRPKAVLPSGTCEPMPSKRPKPAAQALNRAGKHSTAKWKQLLRGPPPTPMCACKPAQPAVERKVMKEGPNFHRIFYVCSKPEGRKEAGGRCDFFVWGSDLEKRTEHQQQQKQKQAASAAKPRQAPR